jgi:hypothetical protein
MRSEYRRAGEPSDEEERVKTQLYLNHFHIVLKHESIGSGLTRMLQCIAYLA